MNFKTRIISSNKGAAFIVALLILVTITILGIVILINSTTDVKVSGNIRTGEEAFYLAEAGVQRGFRQINNNVATSPLYYNDSAHLGAIFSNQSLGNGNYSVTIASDGTDSNGNKILSVTSTGTIPSAGAVKKVIIRIIPQYTNASLFKYAAFGKNGVTLTGNAEVDSYDSSKGAYSEASAKSNGNVGTNATSNGVISLTGNAEISGSAAVGPSANPSTAITLTGDSSISGSKSSLTNAEVFPDVTIPSGLTPGTALSISGNNTVNLAAGTYYYTSISISGNGTLNINGNVKIYVSGSVSASGNGIVNTTSNPANCQLMVSGTSSVSIVGNGGFYGGVYAPHAPVSITGNGALYGSVVGTTIDFTGNAQLHYDEAMTSLGGGNVLSSYKISSWKEITS